MLNAINWQMAAHCVLACFFSQSDTEFWDKMQAEWEELARRNWLDNPDNEGPIPLNVSPNESVRALQSGEDIFFLEGIFASSFDWLGFSRSCWTCYLGISCVLYGLRMWKHFSRCFARVIRVIWWKRTIHLSLIWNSLSSVSNCISGYRWWCIINAVLIALMRDSYSRAVNICISNCLPVLKYELCICIYLKNVLHSAKLITLILHWI